MTEQYRYYEVWVSSLKYHRNTPLTYKYSGRLEIGTLVVVPLQSQKVAGLVVKEVGKPDFSVKTVLEIIHKDFLPEQLPRLLKWIKEYYPAFLGQLMTLVLPSGLTKKSRSTSKTNESTATPSSPLPPLTKEQSTVLRSIRDARPTSVLLHGDTGTGKTRVYLELIRDAFAQGTSALVLTPEIGLTPQLVLACEAAFPGRTVVMHSDLTPQKRRDAWLKILESTHPVVVVGARSALFVPLRNIGLIVIDEFHETSYKQEQSPYYLASRVAAKLASLHGAQLLLGSATPPIADYYTFKEKGLPILRMREPALTKTIAQPNITIIDLKKRELFRRSPWLSNKLLDALSRALERNEQTLLFLNRRGTARVVLCQKCGWQAVCPHCDITLTYHGDTYVIRCHMCGYHEKTPSNCPNCSSNDIIFQAIGTKSLIAELNRLFPEATTKRFDSDTQKSERLEQQYSEIKAGTVDILVGTQMLGKGLDLPKLSVLGVVFADTSLSFPDYTAEERTFQLLAQVIGRVNRGHLAGNIYIQTHKPDSSLLQSVLTKDYETFYSQQLAERRTYRYPPFRFILKLTCHYARQTSARDASEKLANALKNSSKIEVIGPSPAFVEKTHGRYHWQIIVKSTDRSELTKIIESLPSHWSYDIDPINLL